MITRLETQISSQFGEMWASQVLSSTPLPKLRSLETHRPSRRQSAFSIYNLRLLFPYTAMLAALSFLIYLIIIAFFSFAFFLLIPHKVRYSARAPANAVLPTHHLATVRILLHVASAFACSTYFLDPVLHSALTLAYYGRK
jgi:hypothetical protein